MKIKRYGGEDPGVLVQCFGCGEVVTPYITLARKFEARCMRCNAFIEATSIEFVDFKWRDLVRARRECGCKMKMVYAVLTKGGSYGDFDETISAAYDSEEAARQHLIDSTDSSTHLWVETLRVFDDNDEWKAWVKENSRDDDED